MVPLFSARIESSRPVNRTVKRGRLGAPCSGQVGNYFLRGARLFLQQLAHLVCLPRRTLAAYPNVDESPLAILAIQRLLEFVAAVRQQGALVHKFSASALATWRLLSLFVIHFDLFALRCDSPLATVGLLEKHFVDVQHLAFVSSASPAKSTLPVYTGTLGMSKIASIGCLLLDLFISTTQMCSQRNSGTCKCF